MSKSNYVWCALWLWKPLLLATDFLEEKLVKSIDLELTMYRQICLLLKHSLTFMYELMILIEKKTPPVLTYQILKELAYCRAYT